MNAEQVQQAQTDLVLLDRLIAELPMPRQGHVQAQQAIGRLNDLIGEMRAMSHTPPEPPKEE